MAHKRDVVITITGVRITPGRDQELGHALMNTLHHVCKGETDVVAVTFSEAEDF